MTRLYRAALTFASLSAGAATALSLGAQLAGAQAVPANPWSLGVDAGLSSSRAFFGGERAGRVSDVGLPQQALRVAYRVSPALQLEVPLSLAHLGTEHTSLQVARVGMNGNLFPLAGAVRPFVGGGAFVYYTRFHTTETLDEPASSALFEPPDMAAQFGARVQGGVELQATPTISLRPALFYERLNDRERAGRAGYDATGGTLGVTLHAGPQTAAPSNGAVQVSIGAELARVRTGAIVADPLVNIAGERYTTFYAPAPSIGVFFPVSANRQLMLGANAHYALAGGDAGSAHDVLVQPRLELNLNPHYRTQSGVRLGAHADYSNTTITGMYRIRSSADRWGGGADLSLTFPMTRTMLFRVGAGYDYLAANRPQLVQSSQQLSLKLGFDAY
jgi:hypothetical protein